MRTFMLLLVALGLSAAQARAADEADMLASLRQDHPRLIILDEQVRSTREQLETVAELQQRWRRFQEQAQRHFDGPTVTYEIVGPRLLIQSRNCLNRVYAFATLYRMDGDRKWVDRAVRELEAAAAFPDWNPRHFLDTAEMTHAFAIGYDWLYPALTDQQRTMLRTALVEKGLKPGLQAYETGRNGWWRNADHNWNQVCNGGLVLGALAVADEEPQLARQIITHALASLPRAMKSFAPDGGWVEGPGYWNYTLRYTMPLILGLESALGHDFGLSAFEGFSQTGAFRLHMSGPGGLPFNYADAGTGRIRGDWMMHAMGRRFERPGYHQAGGMEPWGLGLFFYQPPPADHDALEPLDRWFRGVDIVFMRSAWADPQASFVGFKGGDNRANHAHLDLGTFVFDALGHRWALELGADDYNMPGYFGKNRWTYYRLNTHGQNTLLLNDHDQPADAKSPIIAFSGGDTPRAIADLSAGYAQDAKRTWRGVALVHERRGLLVQDEFEADVPAAYLWQMHTTAEIRIASPTSATLELDGKRLHVTLNSNVGGTFAIRELDLKPPQKPAPGVRKLVVELPEPVKQARIAVILSPSDAPVDIQPLETWIDQGPSPSAAR